jgi:SnoaL-like domain
VTFDPDRMPDLEDYDAPPHGSLRQRVTGTANGSKYVAVVFAVLATYGAYEWWFNPVRAVQRRLGTIAATLSTPPSETDFARAARLARLRPLLAEDIRVRIAPDAPEITSRGALLAALATLRPDATGWDVQFVDTKVTLEDDDSAHAHMTVEVTSRDARTGEPTVDARSADVEIARRSGEWVVTSAESRAILTRP